MTGEAILQRVLGRWGQQDSLVTAIAQWVGQAIIEGRLAAALKRAIVLGGLAAIERSGWTGQAAEGLLP